MNAFSFSSLLKDARPFFEVRRNPFLLGVRTNIELETRGSPRRTRRAGTRNAPCTRRCALKKAAQGVSTCHRAGSSATVIWGNWAIRQSGQTLQGSFSAVSKPNVASEYSCESSRRDLHYALFCTVLQSQFRVNNLQTFC